MPTTRVTAEIAGTLRAELARTRHTQAWLGDIIGVTQSQVSKMLLGKVALDLDQLAAACEAFGLVMSEVIRDAEAAAGGISTDIPGSDYATRGLAHLPSDPRTLIRTLLDNPDMDDELNYRLSQSARHIGDSSSRAKRLAQEIRQLRREELERALADLPPTTARVVNGDSQ